ETWERLSPCVIPSKEWGVAYLNGNPIACADPSNIWKFNGLYHLQAGNLLLLNQYGRQLNSPEDMRGDWTEHFTSVDLLHWEYQGRFYQRNRSNEWTQPDEDAMCACFLPLPTSSEGSEASCVWLQLFLSHNRGCQYYLGYYDGTYFTPSSHGRMTYTDSSFFAPEAWLDVHGRQLMLCWMKDNPVNDFARFGWSGVFSLPRTLWLSNGKLCMRPVPELHALRGIHTVYASDILSEKSVILMVNTPFACELHFIILPGQNRSLSLTIAGEYATNQYACASINTQKNLLSFETTWRQGVLLPCEHAPLIIDDKDEINVTVYIDRSILEIFANDSQALCRRFYPPVDLKPILSISGQGNISLMESWLMNPLGTE
ncbi:MAG: GH32 C-terminal domain-containing protein, partial [Raoultibacter sp.]